MFKQKYLYLLFLLLLSSIGVFAQDFTATVSKNKVEVGQQFTLQYVIRTNAKDFTPPALNDFKLLGGPNQGRSTNWVNGKVSSQVTISYVLTPKKEGTFVIPPAKIVTDRGELSTKPITITAKKITEADKQNAAREYIYLKATVSRTNLYVGEQLTATYKLYTKVNIQKYEFTRTPELTGFWNKEFDTEGEGKVEVINGQQWTVYLLKKVILVPQQSGDLIVDPFGMDFIIEKPNTRRSIFSRGETVSLKLSSRPIKINVKALPKNAPSSFNGAVGEFSLSSSINKTEVQANDGIDYKIKIAGQGNFHLFSQVATQFPEDFEVYDPKISNNYAIKYNGTKGSKEWNYLVRPRFGGDFTIPSLPFTYFSPKKGKYVTLQTDEFQLKVAKGKNEENTTFRSQVNKENVEELDHTIRYIHTSGTNLNKSSKSWFGSWLHYLLLGLAPLLVLVGFVFKQRLQVANNDVIGTRRKKANKVATKYLAEASKNKADQAKFYELLGKALYGYLSDKLSIPLSELNQEKIKEKLTHSLSEANIKSLLETLDSCEMAKYAPMTSVSEEELLKKAEVIIELIEKGNG